MENKQIKIAPDVKPIYADEVNVNSNIKVSIEKDKDGNDKVSKVGRIDLLFFDQFTKSITTRVILDPYTAKVFAKILKKNAEKVIEEMEKDELPPEVRAKLEQGHDNSEDHNITTYIG